MTDPKIRDHFASDDELRPSHDMLETAREIRVSPEEQEEAVAHEEQRRREQATRVLHEQAVTAFEAAVAARQRGKRWLLIHAVAFSAGNTALFAINQITAGSAWFQWPLLGWTLALAGHVGWFLSRPKAVAPPSVAEAPRGASLRPSAPRPLAGRGRDDANEDAQARARTTQRTSRKRD